MGHYAELKCLDCDEVMELGEWAKGSGGVEVAKAILENIETFSKLQDIAKGDMLEVHYGGCWVPIEWLHKHKEHRLIVIWDYGCGVDQCYKGWKWNGQKPCLLEEGHEGPCNIEEGPFKVRKRRDDDEGGTQEETG